MIGQIAKETAGPNGEEAFVHIGTIHSIVGDQNL